MKKSILIIAILFCQNTFCQSYTFDRFIQYNSDSSARTIFMFNSKDSSYYFIARSYDKEITGNIIEVENKVRHRFSVTNIKNAVQFEYLDSSIETESKVFCPDKYNVFEVIKTPFDSLNTDFTVLKYKNSEKKRTIASSNITAIKSEIPVFSIMMNSFLGHLIYCQKIDFPENYLPTSVEIDYYNGIKTRDRLMQNKEISVVLSVNKKM